MNTNIIELKKGLNTAFIDATQNSNLAYRPQFVYNDNEKGQKVFGSKIRAGIVSGNQHDYEADFVFATVQTLSKMKNLQKFPKEYFEACIYDEAHHTSAESFKRVMDYFTPKFTLGMTATPDKRDDNVEGRNIYEIFNHNIAYEIRLQQAMEEDLLCPFHYFGITDLHMISDEGKTKEEQLENFRYLTSDERVKYVMDQAKYFGYSGERVKGLIFCSRIEEARELSRKFNKCGWRTMALSGADSEEERARAIERLTMDVQSEEDDYLDYLITVDIFSEGWEFPGGKIEPGETPQEALKREIQEELDTKIKVGSLIDTIEYDYPTFHLSMDCFLAEIESGNLVLKEHEAARWLTREELDSVDWLPADVLLIDTLKQSKLITPEKEV